METQEFLADPQQLRAEAEKELRRRGLEDYAGAIRVLKDDKGFSFREIAGWLQERGLKTDHNAVWRAYSKAASGASAQGGSEQFEQSERRGHYDGAMAWEKG